MHATPSAMTSGALRTDASEPSFDGRRFDADLLDEPDAADAADVGFDAAAQPARASARSSADVNDGQLNEWIESIVGHDEGALTALYDATLSRVYGFVLRIVRQPALAEEVVEDTYFQVWRQAARFDLTRGRALTWLLGMARSRAIDALRREARFRCESADLDSLSDAQDPARSADDLLDAARGHADLHRALMLLNAQPRQLVALAFFKGLSHEEIASETALPLGTVKSQIRRALLTLRQVLGDAGLSAIAS